MAEMEVAKAAGSLRLDFWFELLAELVFEGVREAEDSLSEFDACESERAGLFEVGESESEAARSMGANSSSLSSISDGSSASELEEELW